MTLLQLSLPRMNGAAARAHVAEVAEALDGRVDELAIELASAITKEVRLYQTTAPVPFDTVVEGCASNIRPVLEAITADTEFDTSAAAALGLERARDGVPLSSVMEAYRVGFHGVWDAAMKESAARSNHNGDAVRFKNSTRALTL